MRISQWDCIDDIYLSIFRNSLHIVLASPVILSKCLYFQNDNSLFINEELADLLHIKFAADIILPCS